MAGSKKKDPDSSVWETQWVLPPVERDKGASAKRDSVGRGGKPEQTVTNHIADRIEISCINAVYFVLLCATPAGLCRLFWTCSGVKVGCLQEMAKKQPGCDV